MCTLTKRMASGLEAGRALSQCWRNSQPRSICFNIILIPLTTLLAEALHLFNPLCSFFFITITAVAFTSALATATHTLPKRLGKASKKRIFYGQADRKGGGRMIFSPFFHWILIPWYPKQILSHCEGPQKCIFHVLNVSAIPLFDDFVTEQQQTVRKNWLF